MVLWIALLQWIVRRTLRKFNPCLMAIKKITEVGTLMNNLNLLHVPNMHLQVPVLHESMSHDTKLIQDVREVTRNL